MANEPERIRMTVRGLVLDSNSNSPMVILYDEESERLLPIWIGPAEANAILFHLEGIQVPRPLTHDLTLDLLRTLHAELVEVTVTDLRDSTFYAELGLKTSAGEIRVDSRPSDALALALRADAEIFVTKSVLDQAKADVALKRMPGEEDLQKYLEDLDDDELGEYEM